MSHHQSRADRSSDSQQKRNSARSGTHHRASAANTLKGGGHHGPSTASAPLLSPSIQPSPFPSSKRSTGTNGQTKGHSSAYYEADNQRAQQGAVQYQGQPHGENASISSGNGNPRASKPVTPSTSSIGSAESVPAVSKPESAWSSSHPQLSFQFGSIGPAFMHTGVQVSPRTSSAPPSIEEQKQDQSRYKANTAVPAKGNGPVGGHQQQPQATRTQSQQFGGHHQQSSRPQVQQPGAVIPVGTAQTQYVNNQPSQHPIQMQMPQNNSHVQVQTTPLHMSMPAHFVPPQPQQQGLVQLPYPPVQFPGPNIPNPMLGPQLASMSPQPIPQMPHQLSGVSPSPLGTGMSGSPYAMIQVPNHFMQVPKSRAVKIVHPQTHEVLKFDSKNSKNDSLNESTSPLSQRRMAGNGPHSRPMLGHSRVHSSHGMHSTQQNGAYVPVQNYHLPTEPRTELQKQNFRDALRGGAVSSPCSVTTSGSVNEENNDVSSHTTQPTTHLGEDENLNSQKSENTPVSPVPDVTGQVGESVMNVEKETNSKPEKSESSEGFFASVIKDDGRVDEQPREAQLDPACLGAVLTKDAVRVHMQAKEAQGDPDLLNDAGKDDSMPEVKHGNKKKKKREALSKASSAVAKLQVEAKRQAEGKLADAHTVKSTTLKSEDYIEEKELVPPSSERGMDSKEGLDAKGAEMKQELDLTEGVNLEESETVTTSGCSAGLSVQVDSSTSTTIEQTESDVQASVKEDESIEVKGSMKAIENSLSALSLEPMVNKFPDCNDESISHKESSEGGNTNETLVVHEENAEDTHHVGSVVLPILDVNPSQCSIETLETVNIVTGLPHTVEDTIETREISKIRGEDGFCVAPLIAHDVNIASHVNGELHTVSSNDGIEMHNKAAKQGETIAQVQMVCNLDNRTTVTAKKGVALADMHGTVSVDTKQAGKKKKRKDALAKANAAGTADLYNAFTAPEEKKPETKILKTEDTKLLSTASVNEPAVPEGSTTSKELDDWEDAVELPTPKTSSMAEVAGNGGKSAHAMYSKDFLMTFKDQHRELPTDFELKQDIFELLVNPQLASQQLSSKIVDRQLSGGSRRGMVDDDRWPRQSQGLHSPSWPENYMDMGPPGGFRPGGAQGLITRMPSNIRPGVSVGPMSSGLIPGKPSTPSPISGVRSNTVDSDRWQRMPTGQKGLIPSPHNQLPAVHKAEKRYEIGRVADGEESKQRQIKGILNKLTPQNFDKLFKKVNDVDIQSAVTLNGVISQIFDKALTEPTFCEMYAKFCKQLASQMPEFLEADEKVTFKRVLLNKCQEEFERGEKEQDEASKVEEGKDLSPEEREEKRVKGKRRMLGNIRFIGELYKKQMLTERIMHACIIKLLGELENPEEEDIEALCKLVSTIGHMIDQPKAKDHMEAYFERFNRLSHNQKLSSRVRFMLKDVIDLRMNGWQERRKVDGPKTIEEVHRDAVQERQATAAQAGRLSRGSSMNAIAGRRIMASSDFTIRGPSSPMFSPATLMGGAPIGGLRGASSHGRNSFVQDVRMETSWETRPTPLAHRPLDEAPLTLGPQGGLGKGIRSQQPEGRRLGPASMEAYNSGLVPTPPERSDRHVSGSSIRSSRHLERTLSDKAVSTSATLSEHNQQQNSSRPSTAPAFVPLDEDQLSEQSKSALVEYFSARDVKEVIRCIEEFRASKFYSTMVYIWIFLALEKKEMERELFINLLINLCQSEPFILKPDIIFQGFEMAIENLEDFSMDVPKAPQYLVGMLKKLISERVLSNEQVSDLVKKTDLIGSPDFLGQETDTITPLSIQYLEKALSDHFNRNQPVSELEKWLEKNATIEMQSDVSFLRTLMTHVLRHSTSAIYEENHDELRKHVSQFRTVLRRFAADLDKQRQYIVAMQHFVHNTADPAGLMATLCSIFYEDQVISEPVYVEAQR